MSRTWKTAKKVGEIGRENSAFKSNPGRVQCKEILGVYFVIISPLMCYWIRCCRDGSCWVRTAPRRWARWLWSGYLPSSSLPSCPRGCPSTGRSARPLSSMAMAISSLCHSLYRGWNCDICLTLKNLSEQQHQRMNSQFLSLLSFSPTNRRWLKLTRLQARAVACRHWRRFGGRRDNLSLPDVYHGSGNSSEVCHWHAAAYNPPTSGTKCHRMSRRSPCR